MARAFWNGHLLAEADDAKTADGAVYFPPRSVVLGYLRPSRRCHVPGHGEAVCFDIEIDGERNEAAAWCLTEPEPGARRLRDHVAFWKGVLVQR